MFVVLMIATMSADNPLRIVFFGTPDFAVESLEALISDNRHVVAIVTAPDKPAGRGKKLQEPAVKTAALRHGIPVLQPTNLKDESFIKALASYQADLQIVVAFRMLPEVVWNMPKKGTYNVHASLLPNYRGAAPINWAIINGETETGVTTFKLKHEIDTGNILLQSKVEITSEDNAGSLHDKLMEAGAKLLLESVDQIQNGTETLSPQASSGGKNAPKIQKSDCQINYAQKAEHVRNFIRGMAPFPGAFMEVFDGEETAKWKVFSFTISDQPSNSAGMIKQVDDKLMVSCEDFWLILDQIQAPGKKRMNTEDFLRGFQKGFSEFKILG